MASVCGVTLVKKMYYRGDINEEYSNQYWFDGATPADSTAWKALADALIDQEKTVYTGDAWTVRAYGYDDPIGAGTSEAPKPVSVWTYDYEAAAATVPGTLSQGTGVLAAGDAAVWCRWKTSRLNSKGKAIYLRKYYHPAIQKSGTGSDRDVILAAQKTALQAFATKLWDGTFLSGRKITAAQHDDTIIGSNASSYITTRTLHRRGKRPGA